MTDENEFDTSKYDVDLDYVDSVYTELSEMQVELDANPIEFGPRRLNDKTAQLRGMLDKCEHVFVTVSHELQKLRRAHRRASTELALETNRLLTEDMEVARGRSITERQAIVKVKLGDLVGFIEVLEAGIEEYDQALIVVKAKRADLKDTSSRIRDQIRLCRDEVEYLGTRWGSKVPGAKSVVGREDVSDLLAPVERAVREQAAPPAPVAVSPPKINGNGQVGSPKIAMPAQAAPTDIDSFFDSDDSEVEKIDSGVAIDQAVDDFMASLF